MRSSKSVGGSMFYSGREMNASEQFELLQPLQIRFHRFSNHCKASNQLDGNDLNIINCSKYNGKTETTQNGKSPKENQKALNVYEIYSNLEDINGNQELCPTHSTARRGSHCTLLGSDYQLEVERNRRLLAERAAVASSKSNSSTYCCSSKSASASTSTSRAAVADRQASAAANVNAYTSACKVECSIASNSAAASTASAQAASVRNNRFSFAPAINSGASSASTSNPSSSSQQLCEASGSHSHSHPKFYGYGKVQKIAPLVIVTTIDPNNDCCSFIPSHLYNADAIPASGEADENKRSNTSIAAQESSPPGLTTAGVPLPDSVFSSSLSYYLQDATSTLSLNEVGCLRTPTASASECETDSDREREAGNTHSCGSPTNSIEPPFDQSRRSSCIIASPLSPTKPVSLAVPGVKASTISSSSHEMEPAVIELDRPSDTVNSNSNSNSSTHYASARNTSAGEWMRKVRTATENNSMLRTNRVSLAPDQHRMSLLGKPICIKQFRQARNDARWRKLQSKIYNFLERPKTIDAIAYHVLVFISVFICLLLSVLSTIESYKDFGGPALFHMESVMLLWFTVEYVLRMWSAGCRSRYQGWRGRLLFARRPFCIIDLIVILASTAVLIISICHGELEMEFVASPLRALRFFQILRMMRMDRRGGSFKLLASVVWAHRQELFTTVYIGFLILISTAFLMYLAEKDHSSSKFQNFADALWWGVITLCTVGYGDTVPQTPIGKVIASVCAVAGISFFALPAGILGSGFALKVQQHQRQKHLIRRRGPAAFLIQACWRVYVADPHSSSVATWRPHLKPIPSPTVEKSRFGRLTIRRKSFTLRHSNSGASQYRDEQRPSKGNNSNDFAPYNNLSSPEKAKQTKEKEQLSGLRIKEDDSDEAVYLLTETHKNAIRAIRKIKFLVARRKFRETLRPYDVKDVIEQYAAGHLDMLSRIKLLQARLEQILGRSNNKDFYDSKICLAARIVNVERVVEQTEMRMESLMQFAETQNEILSAICGHLNINVGEVPVALRVAVVGNTAANTNINANTSVNATATSTDATSGGTEEILRRHSQCNNQSQGHSRLVASMSVPYTGSHLLSPPLAAPRTRNKQDTAGVARCSFDCGSLKTAADRSDNNNKVDDKVVGEKTNACLSFVAKDKDKDNVAESNRANNNNNNSSNSNAKAIAASDQEKPTSRFRKAKSLKCAGRQVEDSNVKMVVDAATQTSVTTESRAGLLIRISDGEMDKLKSSSAHQNGSGD